ncbi:TRAP transporter small permease [Marinococcus sp. PL1-022]|uniref:TRAP transporter small permease n=1 Tax=Marinococcus sp. PL1-022 TaxID=3095363 RepID=UPI0029C53976|nr:TRAP transporter small permease [Marinococcus sp. PL1-022]MDX6152730.1 TRAP transporter small permease [Marinococcus sp. PL1-022]
MQKVKIILDRTLLIVNSVLITCMALLSIWQVFTRYVLDAPSTTSEEIIRFMLIWFTLLTAAYVFGQKKHIAIVFLIEKFRERSQRFIGLAINILWVFLGIVPMIIGGIILLSYTYSETAPATGMSMLFVYSAVPASGVCIVLYAVIDMVRGSSRIGTAGEGEKG